MISLPSPRRRPRLDAIEVLEARIAPATLVFLDPATHVLTVQGDYVDDGSSTAQMGASENLTFSVSNGSLAISDPAHGVTGASSGITQVSPNQVNIPMASLTGDFAIDTGSGADSLFFGGTLALPANKGLIAHTTGTITFAPTAAVSASGTGTLSFTSDRDISIATGASLKVVDGDLDLTAHGASSGNYSGISLGGSLMSSGGGFIKLFGTGGDSTSANHGLDLHGSIVGGAGAVDLTGFGGPGVDANHGISATSGSITAGPGGIAFSGTPGGDAGQSLGINLGITVTSTGDVQLVSDSGISFAAGAHISAANQRVELHEITTGTAISLGAIQHDKFGVSDAMIAAIDATKVVIGDAQAGAISLNAAINSSKTLELKSGASVSGPTDLTLGAGMDLLVESAGTIQLDGVITVPGALTLTGVGGDIGMSVVNAANGFNIVHIVNGASVQLRAADGFSFDAHASTLLSLESPAFMSQLGAITGGGDLHKLGTGTLQLSHANVIGNTTIAVGSIVFSDPGAFSTGTITLGDPAAGSTDVSLIAGGAIPSGSFTNPIVVPNIAGGGVVKIGSVAAAGAVHYQGTMTLNRATTFESANTGGTFYEGAISGNVGTLTIEGGGTSVFRLATNSFNGDLKLIGSSTLELRSPTDEIPDSSNVFIEQGSFLLLSKPLGLGETIANLTGDGTVSTSSTSTTPQTLSITAATGTSFQFDGFIQDGAGSLSITKDGAGTATLTNQLTYSGATVVKAGTLKLVNSDFDNPIASSAVVDIRSGATLDVTGLTPGNDPQTLALAAGQTLIGSGTLLGSLVSLGKVAPGGATSHGILTINGNFTPQGELDFKVNGPYTTPGVDYDQIAVGAGFLADLSGAKLVLSGGDANPAAGLTVTLLANNGPGPTVAGTSPAEGALIGVGSATFTLNYNAGNGHDVVLTTSAGQTSLSATLTAGKLTISDTANRPHRFDYSVQGPRIVVNDPVEFFAAAPAGAALADNGHTLVIPSALVKAVQITGGGSDDVLTVDFGSSPTKLPAGGLVFNGGLQATAGGDQLVLLSFTNEGAVTYAYTSPSAGSVTLGNYGKVSLTGLEAVENTGQATKQVFNLTKAANHVALGDDGVVGNGLTRLSGDTIPITDFAAPSVRGANTGVSINPGTANDSLSVLLLPDFADNLEIAAPLNRFHSVSFINSLDLAGTLELDADVIDLAGGLHISAPDGELGISGGSINGVIGGGLSLVKTVNATPGTSLFLNAANTYTGETAVVDGPLILGNALATQNSTVRIFSGELLQFQSGIGAFTVGGLAGTGALALVDDAGAAVTLNAGANTSTYAGALSGMGTLHKVGFGALTLTGKNTHAGTFLEQGVLLINSDAALGATGAALTGDGGILQAAATTTVARNIVLLSATSFQASPGKTLTLSGVISGSGDFLVGEIGTVLVTGQSNTNTGSEELGGGASEMVNGVSISTPGIHSGVMVKAGPTPGDIASIDLTGVNVPVSLVLKSPKTGSETIERIISTDATPVKMISLGAHVTLGNGLADALPDLEVDGQLSTLQLSDVSANAIIRLGQDLPYLATYKNAPNVTLNNILGSGVTIDVTGDGVHPAAVGGGGLGKVVVNSWPMDGLIKTTQGIKSFTVKTGDAHVSLEVDPNHLGAATTGNVGLISIPAGQWAGADMQVEGVVAQFLTKGLAAGSTITAGAFGTVNIKGNYSGSIFAKYDATVGTLLPGNKIKVAATGAIGSVAISSGDFTGVVSGDGKVGNISLTGTARFMGTLRGGSLGNITAASFTGTGALPGDPRHTITAIGSIGNITAKTGGLTDYIIAAGADLGSDALFGGVADTFHSYYLTATNVKTAVSIGAITIKGVVQNTTIAAGVDPGADGLYGDFTDALVTLPPEVTKTKVKIGPMTFDANPASALTFSGTAPSTVTNAFEAEVLTSVKFGNGASATTNPQFKNDFTVPTFFDSGGSSVVVRVLS